MKTTKLIAGVFMAMALVGCSQEEALDNGFGLKELKVEVEGYRVASRVGFTDGDADFFWTTGDKIGVTTTASSTFQGMTLDGEGGNATGKFTGSMSGTPSGYAVYPYGAMGRHTLADETLSYTLPASYTYTTLDATYAKADGNSYNAPMWGKITNSSASFKHLGGVIAFSVNGLPESTSGKFVLTATNKINGTFTAALTDSEPVIVSEATDVTDEKTVTIHFSTAEGQTNGYFYVPVPTGSLGNLMLAIVDADGNEVASGAWDNITIARTDVRRATIGEQSITGGMLQEVAAIDQITDEILTSDEEELTVQITTEVSGTDNSITIPSTLQTEVTTFSFTSIADDAAITIGNADGSSYTGQIIIEIPEDETIPAVTANVPEGEVYIKQGTVTTLVTSSAENTTIIGAKAVIGTLIVNKGNVRIEDGGKVTTIQRSEDNTDAVTYVYFEGEVPAEGNTDSKIVYMSADVAEELANLKNAIETGGSYTLQSDVALAEPLVIASGITFTLDLNGKTISQSKECTESYNMITNKGTLTIQDNSTDGSGKISFTDTSAGGSSVWGSYTINNYGTLVIDGGTIEHVGSTGSWTDRPTNIPVQNYQGKVTVNDEATISSPMFRSLRDFTAGGEIIINGGTFKGQVWMQGLGTGSSSLTITGGDFTPTAGYDGSSVYITNGTNDINVSITGGKFNTKIGCADATKAGVKGSVMGGIFTETAKTNTNSDLIAEGCVFENNTDGTYILTKAFVEVNETSYQIYNVTGLKLFRDAVNAGNTYEDCTIELMDNLDLNNENWTPIGFNDNERTETSPTIYFAGTFEGNDKTISNLKIDVEDRGGVGLFGVVYNATFKNFSLENVDIKAVESEDNPSDTSGSSSGDGDYIVGGHLGAVAGYDAKNGTVAFNNVHVKGLVKIEGETRAKQGQRIAGVFGGKGSSVVSFNNVTVNGDNGSYIKGYCSTAGVMGQNQATGTFTNVSTDIDIVCYSFGAGGVVGIACEGSTFTNCSSAGNITRNQPLAETSNSRYRIGGIAGCWSAAKKAHTLTLTSCSYSGTLTSLDADSKAIDNFDFAGLVGRAYSYGTATIGSTVTIDSNKYVDEGSGIYSINGVCQIANVAGLQVLANLVNSGENYFTGKTVMLTNDIDLNSEEWTPIGSATMEHGFMGNFDGNGYVIKNLSISKIEADSDGYVYAGLLGVTEGTEAEENYIKNLTIENVNISTEGHIVAAAIAYPYYTTIENVTVKGDINIKGGDYTAGVLAYTRRCVNAKNMTISANSGSTIEGGQTVGGVISDIQMNGGLTANYSNFKASGLTITATRNVGGISGIISSQTLDGAIVENVTIVSDDVRKGTVSGALGGKSTIKNISVNNVSGATNVVGATYDDGAEVTVNGDDYEKAETNAGE